MAHEQTSIARVPFAAHSNATDLATVLSVKLKGVKGDYEFCEAYKCRSADDRVDSPTKKEFESFQTIQMRDGCVKRTSSSSM